MTREILPGDRADAGLLVVKLGGSHADVPGLRAAWLRAIAAANGRVVLVPGGGPFADAVRAQQSAMGYDDATAHDMALLAMAQYGLALSATPGFVAVETPAQIDRAHAAKLVPVWLPRAMLARAPQGLKSWSVTSDSLALWLAVRLGASGVLLIKRDADHPGLDAAFPDFRARFSGEIRIAGPDDVPERLDLAALPGLPLAPGTSSPGAAHALPPRAGRPTKPCRSTKTPLAGQGRAPTAATCAHDPAP